MKLKKKNKIVLTQEDRLKIYKKKEEYFKQINLENKLNPNKSNTIPIVKKPKKTTTLYYKEMIPNDYKESNGESKIREYLQAHKIKFCKEVIFSKLPFLRFDFYLPITNTCIEFDGIQHFEYVETFDNGNLDALSGRKKRDLKKNFFCKSSKIRLIRIPYTDIDKINDILNKKL